MSAASTPSQRFPREARLLKRTDFQRVYEHGRRHFSSSITAFYLRRGTTPTGPAETSGTGPRIGITVARALGKAVERARMKRRIRNAVRLHLAMLRVPADIVINPKKSVLTAHFAQLTQEICRTFEVVNEKAQPADVSRPASARSRSVHGKRRGS